MDFKFCFSDCGFGFWLWDFGFRISIFCFLFLYVDFFCCILVLFFIFLIWVCGFGVLDSEKLCFFPIFLFYSVSETVLGDCKLQVD